MIRVPLLALAAVALVNGCATPAAKAPPVCDGRHLRPANPYGSVLQPSPAGQPAAPVTPPVVRPLDPPGAAPGADQVPPSGGCG